MATDPNAKVLKTHDTLPAELAALDDQKLAWRKQMAEPAQTCTTAPNPDPTPDQQAIFDIEESARISVLAQNCTKPQPIRVTPQPGRNQTCPCGSGIKYKRCCITKAA
jgi:hypothetical protein